MISLEKFVCLEFNGYWTVPEHFFENLLFGNFTPTLTNELGIQYFSDWLAGLIIGALLSLSLALIWSTLIGDHVATLHEVSIHVRPATFAPFVEEVALHNLLRRHNWNLLSIFKFKSSLCSLHKSNGIA